MNLNFTEICRLCLRFCDEYVDLNRTNGVKTLADDLIQKIKYCYFVQIDLTEGFPTKVCYECIQVLSFFYTAKKNVISSDKLLRDILFVRKKLEEDMKCPVEENVTSPDIGEVKQDEHKTGPVVLDLRNSEPQKSDPTSVKIIDGEIDCDEKCITNSKITVSPIVETEKKLIVFDNEKGPTLALDKHNSKAKRKKKLKQLKQSLASSGLTPKNTVAKLLTPTNSNLKGLSNDFKKEQSQKGKTSQTVKDCLEVDPPLKENVVKEIGTVIDTNNILSPNVKRSRKSISA